MARSTRDTREATSDTAVIARYPTMEQARRAFMTLQNQGIDAADIRLAGKGAEASERRTTRTRVRNRVDRRLVTHVGLRVVLAAIGGALLGAIVGALVAWILLTVVDDMAGWGWVFAFVTLIPAAIGAVLAVFLTFERSVGLDDTWQLMLDDVGDHDICLAVRVRDQDAAVEVLDALKEEEEPPIGTDIRRATAEGVHTVRTSELGGEATGESSDPPS